ncbi:hypothetical protein NDU88_003968 [Pleurodeles waltl]|uniref:Uncharacterized protein n=1 Tax=Pleurodeles waltl TaxID=8319 RepID=A0AAV7LGZ2_PLEWA|nr:hypothetical protein NDU88_003968 [Pleurodeles waltl]
MGAHGTRANSPGGAQRAREDPHGAVCFPSRPKTGTGGGETGEVESRAACVASSPGSYWLCGGVTGMGRVLYLALCGAPTLPEMIMWTTGAWTPLWLTLHCVERARGGGTA